MFTDRSWPGGANRAMSPDDVAPSTPARRPTGRTDPQLSDATVCILALSVMLIRDCSAQRGTHAINIFLRHPWKQRQAHGASPNVFSVREIAGLVPKLSEDLKQMHRRIVRADPDASIPHSRDKQPAGRPPWQ